MHKNNLLIELLTEELPSKSIHAMSHAFEKEFMHALHSAALTFDNIIPYATPRRLALRVEGLADKQANISQEKKGPPLQAAYDANGQPTAACLGFAKNAGIPVSALTQKDGYVYATQHLPGKTVDELIPTLLNQVCLRLPVPKRMRWGEHAVEFARPVRGIVLLYGPRVIPATLFSLSSGNTTVGHRFHHPEVITLKHADDYENALYQAKVIASFEKRREEIARQIEVIAKEKNATALMPLALLEEVTGLVEWPVSLLAHFSPSFLDVPAESLISAMQTHQKSFALFDNENKLLPMFITVSNLESLRPKRVQHGNEKVMRARLSDAEFFYKTDLQHPLSTHIEGLKHVIFQAPLGTLYDKAERLQFLMTHLSTGFDIETNLVMQTALFAKTDLLTDMVIEFPELQGIMGYYYAKAHHLPESLAIALKEQYLPRYAGDELPKTRLGALLAVADRVDTLVGIFGINRQPTGEKDPFGLRRMAVGLLRILIDQNLDISLLDLLEISIKSYDNKIINPETKAQVFEFIIERLRYYLIEKNVSPDIFAAVRAKCPESPVDFVKRVEALQRFTQLTEASALASAHKRVSRILEKEETLLLSQTINKQLLKETAEKNLVKLLEAKKNIAIPLFEAKAYDDALTQLVALKPAIDTFFDEVLVLDENEALRHNRLTLLFQLRQLFLEIADISLLQLS